MAKELFIPERTIRVRAESLFNLIGDNNLGKATSEADARKQAIDLIRKKKDAEAARILGNIEAVQIRADYNSRVTNFLETLAKDFGIKHFWADLPVRQPKTGQVKQEKGAPSPDGKKKNPTRMTDLAAAALFSKLTAPFHNKDRFLALQTAYPEIAENPKYSSKALATTRIFNPYTRPAVESLMVAAEALSLKTEEPLPSPEDLDQYQGMLGDKKIFPTTLDLIKRISALPELQGKPLGEIFASLNGKKK